VSPGQPACLYCTLLGLNDSQVAGGGDRRYVADKFLSLLGQFGTFSTTR